MVTGIQIKMARAALGWGVHELGKKATVNANTISRIENDKDALNSTLESLQKTLEEAGVEFLPNNGVRLKNKEQ